MSKSAPKVSDSLKSLQGKSPGIWTPAFSLARQTPAKTTTTTPARTSSGGSGPVLNLEAERENRRFLPFSQLNASAQASSRAGGAGETTTTTPGSGPFSLTRSSSFVPDKESELFQLLGSNRLGIGGLFGNIDSTRSALSGQQDRTAGLFDETGRLRGNLDELLAEVRPGFGRLVESARETVRNRFSESVGNLRDSLTKRGLQGSSFAINETRRAELDFAQQEEELVSEAIIQEIDLRRQIIGDAGKLIELDQATLSIQAQQIGLQLGLNEQEANVFRDTLVNIQAEASLLGQQVARELNELGVAGNIINAQQAIVADLAKAQVQLEAQAAADSGSLLGSIFGTVLGAAGGAGGFSELFS